MDIINIFLPSSYVAILILQIACIVHVIKQGKEYYWIFLILFFPAIGSIVYFIIEVLPGLKGQTIIKSLGKKKKASKGDIRKLKEQLEYTNTVENKLNVADAHLSRGEYSESSIIYADCMSGMYANDHTIMHRLAESRHGEKKYAEAKDLLKKLKEANYKDYSNDRDFLLILCLVGMGEEENAIKILKNTADAYPGEEARYLLGALYLNAGKTEEAAQLFKEVIGNKKHYKKASIGSQAKWVSLARKRLKEIQ